MRNLDRYAPQALGVLRIMTALLFIQHGTQKLFGFPTATMETLPTILLVGAWIEVIGGLLFLLGLFTRPVAFVLSGTMAVAYFMFHMPGNFFPALNGGDAAILFCFIFLTFVFTGPGAFALSGGDRRGTATA